MFAERDFVVDVVVPLDSISVVGWANVGTFVETAASLAWIVLLGPVDLFAANSPL